MRGRSFSLFLSGVVGHAAVPLAAEPPAVITEACHGSYAGEAVVRSVGDPSPVVAIDATGEAADIDYQTYGDGNNGGGGCVRSCNVSCGDGSSCSASCGAGQCGNCSCTFGASCSCK